MFLLANRLGIAQHIMNREPCGGFDVDRLPALGADMIRPVDNDFAPFFFFFMNACFFNRLAELQGRAVHDRHLSLHFDEQIGDAIAV